MEATTLSRASGAEGRTPTHRNLALAFHATADRLDDRTAIVSGDDTMSWAELRAKAAAVAGGLKSLGVGRGDTVAIMLNNRLEFIALDLGAVTLGAVPFSLYQTSAPEQIEYICTDAACKVAIVEKALLDTFMEARQNLPELEHVITLDGAGGTMTVEELLEVDPDFDDSVAGEIEPEDLLTLIYTSGTTGPPKGVQLTHQNLMSLVANVDEVIPFPSEDEERHVISWLPAAHIAERGVHYYLPVTEGVTVTVCADPRKIIEVLPQVRPTWFFAVPRIWEKLKAGLEAKLSALPDEAREPVAKGLEAAIAKVRAEQAGEPVPDDVAAAAAAAEEGMFKAMREQLGLDRLAAVNVGAAPTPLEVLEFFHAIGVPIGELWGLSETCGAATLNPPGKIKLGTVGPPLPGVEIKLADDGEVLVRGTSIMAGYRNMPEKTAETIDSDGWLATGDIGELDSEGYLKIVDRKKELIINAAGKNMSPAGIEAHVKAASPLIGQCVAIGDQRPYNVALVTLDPEFAPAWAAKNGIEDNSLAALAENEQVLAAVQEGIDAANERMSRVEQIKKFKLLGDDWEPGGDELTPTMKLKRKPIEEKYTAEIAALYEG
jgi:long-chain acyl-CoA synthetase